MIKKNTALYIPVLDDGSYLIQDRKNKEGSKIDFGIFGGKIEEGEAPLEAIIREIHEELSFLYTADDLNFVGNFYLSFQGVGGYCNLYTRKVGAQEFAKFVCNEGDMKLVKPKDLFKYLDIAHKPLFDKLNELV